MTTPFAKYASLRLLWHRPTAAITSLREGIRPNTEAIVIEAYISELSGPNSEEQSGGRNIGTAQIIGYITRWAQVPTGGNWLDSGKYWVWNDSGLRPQGFPRGEKLEAFMGNIAGLPTQDGAERGWLTIQTLPSVGGIDALVRVKTGDKFTGLYAAGR